MGKTHVKLTSSLPGSSANAGDRYYAEDTGVHYVWNGASMINLGVVSDDLAGELAAETIRAIATSTKAPVAAPATAVSAGVAGSWAYDATHIYVCIATNSWVRATLAAW